jgi:hypothetical protein
MGVLIPLGVLLIALLIGVMFYTFSVLSRKSYRCPKCGERVSVEYMEAKRCGMCGAPLERQ